MQSLTRPIISMQRRSFWGSSKEDEDKLQLEKAKKAAAAERVLKAKKEAAAAKKDEPKAEPE